jgi:hypothetical protein
MKEFENLEKTIRDDRQMKALTGISQEEFQFLVSIYREVEREAKEEAYQERKKKNQKARRSGAGEKPVKLDTTEKELFFAFYYMKDYPTFDILGFHFGMSRSRACEHIHRIIPLLAKMFEKLGVKPKRKITSPEEFIEAFGDIEELIIDATERGYMRKKDYEEQKKDYSGKKKPTKRKIPS